MHTIFCAVSEAEAIIMKGKTQLNCPWGYIKKVYAELSYVWNLSCS